MKTQTLFAVGLGTLLVAFTGCKSPERYTNIGNGASGSVGGGGTAGRTGLNLDTTPVAATSAADAITGTPGSGTDVLKGDLPDDSVLDGRDMDRAAFAQQTVYFAYDQSVVRADEASKLDQVAAEFKSKGPGYDLLIEGHCDERGTEEYNRSLGERRALAIRELLIKSGVDGKHIFTRSFGKDQPALVGHDEAAWSKNRRGEFVLVLPKKLLTTQLTK